MLRAFAREARAERRRLLAEDDLAPHVDEAKPIFARAAADRAVGEPMTVYAQGSAIRAMHAALDDPWLIEPRATIVGAFLAAIASQLIEARRVRYTSPMHKKSMGCLRLLAGKIGQRRCLEGQAVSAGDHCELAARAEGCHHFRPVRCVNRCLCGDAVLDRQAGLLARLCENNDHVWCGVFVEADHERAVGRWPEDAIRIADKPHFTRLAGERVGRKATLDTDRPGVKRVDRNRHRRKRGNSQNGGQNMHRQESLSWFAWRQQSTTSDVGRYVLMAPLSMTASHERMTGGRNG